MKYLIEKDKKRRALFEKYEKIRICLRALARDQRLPYGVRVMYKLKLSSFFKNSSKTRIKNRCVITGRGRGVLKYFRFSRLQVRDNVVKGVLYGIRKASW